jgi:hypothetical protein
MKATSALLRDYAPTIGILIFICIYLYATTLYPGGSQADHNSKGFSWMHTYWSTMFHARAMNGEPNAARPISLIGMVILWSSILQFFFMSSETFSTSRRWKRLIQISATLSMAFASLLFTRFHNLVTTVASMFGILAVAGLLLGLARNHLRFLVNTGIVCMFLIAINNCIFYSHHGIYFLPLIQKVTFAIVLLWIIGLNHATVQRRRVTVKSK